MAKYLYFDVESCNAGLEYSMPRHEFIRLFQYALNDGPVQFKEVHTPEDLQWCKDLIESADYVVGHNILSADLSWIYDPQDLTVVKMAMKRKVLDTFYLANLLTPAPTRFQGRDGRWRTLTASQSPVGHNMSWLGLDNLCHQFGIPGKLGNLKELAKKHNPPKTKVADLDFSLIPLDDPEFLAYADQDVIAVRDLWKYLQRVIHESGYNRDYLWREMTRMALTVHQMSRNGILIDRDYAAEKQGIADQKREETMAWLVENYDFPTSGKAPWSTAEGKAAILAVLADHGVTEQSHPHWPRTPTGALKMGGEDLIDLTKGTEAEEFARALAELKGQRSTVQQVTDNIHPDGRVHPDITALQASGRWSFTKPGVTIFGERNEKLREDKKLFIAAPGNVLAGYDFQAADARAMGALSGDPEYMRRFEKDAEGNDLYDAHNLSGEAFFGADTYYGDGPRGKDARPALRNAAKPGGHGQNYNLGAFKMAHMLNEVCRKEGLDLHFWAPKHEKSKTPLPPIERQENSIDTRDMVSSFNDTYVWLKRFKDAAVEEAKEFGYVTNSWGRRMPVEPGREWTAAPALYGQSTTSEMMTDGIIRLAERGDYYILAMRAIIHDELLMEFSADTIERDIAVTRECMEAVFDPGTDVGVPVLFPVGYGYGKSWHDAGH